MDKKKVKENAERNRIITGLYNKAIKEKKENETDVEREERKQAYFEFHRMTDERYSRWEEENKELLKETRKNCNISEEELAKAREYSRKYLEPEVSEEEMQWHKEYVELYKKKP